MLKHAFVLIQYVLPKQLLTILLGYLAESHQTWLKNWLIRRFITSFHVDMSSACIENPSEYPTFNHFFIRQLKPSLRPLCPGENEIACPVDGTIAQIGGIHQNQLLQAKDMYFDLDTLLGNDTELATFFYDGLFTTLYLAPHNYHRVHMPLAGRLVKTRYIPGKLFSVNRMTSELIPQLYSRNERLICLFDSDAGPMAIIFVGAMIVGSIQTAWMNHPVRAKKIQADTCTKPFHLDKGAELGHFKIGSTVILLYGKNRINWSPTLQSGSTVLFGQALGKIFK